MATGSALFMTVTITEFNLPLANITWFIDGAPATEANESSKAADASVHAPVSLKSCYIQNTVEPQELTHTCDCTA